MIRINPNGFENCDIVLRCQMETKIWQLNELVLQLNIQMKYELDKTRTKPYQNWRILVNKPFLIQIMESHASCVNKAIFEVSFMDSYAYFESKRTQKNRSLTCHNLQIIDSINLYYINSTLHDLILGTFTHTHNVIYFSSKCVPNPFTQ